MEQDAHDSEEGAAAAQVLCLQSIVGGRHDGHAAVDVRQMLPQQLSST